MHKYNIHAKYFRFCHFHAKMKSSIHAPLLALIEEHMNELVERFGSREAFFLKLNSVFFATDHISDAIVKIVGLDHKTIGKLTLLLSQFSPELLADLGLAKQTFLIHCMTLGQEVLDGIKIPDVSISDISECLRIARSDLVNSFILLADSIPNDDHVFFFAVASSFVIEARSRTVSYDGWRFDFVMWFIEASCSCKHIFSSSTIYRAIHFNFNCIHDGVSRSLIAYLKKESSLRIHSVFTLVYLDSSLLLSADLQPTLLRFWIRLSESFPQIFSHAQTSHVLKYSRFEISNLIEPIIRSWKESELELRVNIAETILSFIDRNEIEESRFFWNLFCLMGNLLSKRGSHDLNWSFINMDLIMQIALNLDVIKVHWDGHSTETNKFLDDIVSVLIANPVIADFIVRVIAYPA